MRSFFEREVLDFSHAISHAWAEASRIVEALPHTDEAGREIRCHELARAAQRLLRSSAERLGTSLCNWEVQDGRFLRVAEHSWLELKDPLWAIGPTERIVLDVYAVGAHPQVQIVYQSALLARFEARKLREDIRHEVVEWLCREAETKRISPNEWRPPFPHEWRKT